MVISYLHCLLSLPFLPFQMLVTHVCMLSHVQLFATPMDCKLPGSSVHRILQQEYWSGLPFASPGNLLDPRIELKSPTSPALQVDSLLMSHQQAFSPLQLAHFVPSLSSKLTEFCPSSRQRSPIHPLKPSGTPLSSYVESLKKQCFA